MYLQDEKLTVKGLKHTSNTAEGFKKTAPGLVLYPVTSSHQRFNMFKSFRLQESWQRWNSLNVWHVPDPDGIFMFHRTVFFCCGQRSHGLSKCRQSRRFITNVLEWNHKTWNKGCVDVFTICLSEQIHTKLMWARNSDQAGKLLHQRKHLHVISIPAENRSYGHTHQHQSRRSSICHE